MLFSNSNIFFKKKKEHCESTIKNNMRWKLDGWKEKIKIEKRSISIYLEILTLLYGAFLTQKTLNPIKKEDGLADNFEWFLEKYHCIVIDSPCPLKKMKLEVIGKESNDLTVKIPSRETYVKIEDTYAEMLPIVET